VVSCEIRRREGSGVRNAEGRLLVKKKKDKWHVKKDTIFELGGDYSWDDGKGDE